MPNITLSYFDIEGVAECIRLALVLSGVAFNDDRIAFPDWAARKPTTKFGQLPVMKIDDLGEEVAQSHAMLRYVARYYSTTLLPADADANLKVEEACGLVADFDAAWAPALYLGMRPEKFGYPEGFQGTDEGKAKIKEMREGFFKNHMPRFAKYFTDLLEANNGFLAADHPTIADCMLLPSLAKFTKGHIDHVPTTVLEEYPALTAYIQRMRAIPAVQKWYETKSASDLSGGAAVTPAADAPAADAKLRLTYFDIQGLAEQIRLAFAVTGTDFEDRRVKMPEWQELKPTTKYGQLPMLEIGDNTVAQSLAVLRWVGRFGKASPHGALVPADAKGYLKVEEALGLVGDFNNAWGPCVYLSLQPQKYGYAEDFSKTPEGQALIKKMREAFLADSLPQFAKYFSDMITANGGFVAGDHVTIADLALLPSLAKFGAGFIDHVPTTSLDAYPVIKEYMERVRAVPEVAKWYSK